jgi:hypothetical protein
LRNIGGSTADPALPEFAAGKRFLEALHSNMRQFTRADLTFQQLYEWTNERIVDQGFRNLDFRGNVGHSIATSCSPVSETGVCNLYDWTELGCNAGVIFRQ